MIWPDDLEQQSTYRSKSSGVAILLRTQAVKLMVRALAITHAIAQVRYSRNPD